MKKQKLLITGVLIAVTASLITLAVSTLDGQIIPQFDIAEKYVYTPSNITKANPDLAMRVGGYSMNEDILLTKDTVVMTLSGTVLSVDDVIKWDSGSHSYGGVPVTIMVDEKTKDMDTDLELDQGDAFTFYLWGIYLDGSYTIDAHEPQFEIGEKVIVHVGKSIKGPMGTGGDNYFVELGKYGKYKIVEDKAYNERNKDGKSLHRALNEAI